MVQMAQVSIQKKNHQFGQRILPKNTEENLINGIVTQKRQSPALMTGFVISCYHIRLLQKDILLVNLLFDAMLDESCFYRHKEVIHSSSPRADKPPKLLWGTQSHLPGPSPAPEVLVCSPSMLDHGPAWIHILTNRHVSCLLHKSNHITQHPSPKKHREGERWSSHLPEAMGLLPLAARRSWEGAEGRADTQLTEPALETENTMSCKNLLRGINYQKQRRFL